MANVASSFTSALPNCILPLVMGLVHIALDLRSSDDMYKTHDPLENTKRSGWYAWRYNFSHGIIYNYGPEKSCHYYYYNLKHQILKAYLSLVYNYSICLYVYAETTLLKITDHHLKGQPHKSPVNLRPSTPRPAPPLPRKVYCYHYIEQSYVTCTLPADTRRWINIG